jgi:hypothetical protein
MKRHEWWRQAYREDRYLEPYRIGELVRRAEIVTNNDLDLSDELKLTVFKSAQTYDYWLVAWTHLLEEFKLRAYNPLDLFDKKMLPKIDWPGLSAGVRQFQRLNLKPGTFVIKYGEAKYLSPAFETGEIRVNPASFYCDSSLNSAIHDDELEIKVFRRSPLLEAAAKEYGSDLGGVGSRLGVVTETLRAPTNFYVYCMSVEFSPRLFGDFESDACLVIDPREFFFKMAVKTAECLDGWSCFLAPITYIDPFLYERQPLDIVRCKSYEFAYQKEIRMYWLPPEPKTDLAPFEVTIGSLKNYATLIELARETAI